MSQCFLSYENGQSDIIQEHVFFFFFLRYSKGMLFHLYAVLSTSMYGYLQMYNYFLIQVFTCFNSSKEGQQKQFNNIHVLLLMECFSPFCHQIFTILITASTSESHLPKKSTGGLTRGKYTALNFISLHLCKITCCGKVIK